MRVSTSIAIKYQLSNVDPIQLLELRDFDGIRVEKASNARAGWVRCQKWTIYPSYGPQPYTRERQGKFLILFLQRRCMT